MQLVLDTKGIEVKKRNNCFWIRTATNERIISPTRIESIAVTAFCTLSSSAILLAINNKIPIYFMDHLGNVKGRLDSPTFGHLSTVRRNQYHFRNHLVASGWAVDIFKRKLTNQILTLKALKFNKHLDTKLQEDIRKIDLEIQKLDLFSQLYLSNTIPILMGIEGAIAKIYWTWINLALPKNFQFKSRTRQPSLDAFNAALNYLYGILYGVVERAVISVGLDPSLGIIHADQYNKPTLVFDIIEPFRKYVDDLLINAFEKKLIQLSYFDTLPDNSVILNKKGKAFFIPLMNNFLAEKVTLDNKRYTRVNHIYYFAGKLVNLLKTIVENNDQYK